MVEESIRFDSRRMIAVAAERLIGFCLERLGTLRVVDLASMQETNRTLAIGSERLLALACAPDASSLAVMHESGTVAFYRCLPGADEWPAGLELATELRFRLPEFNDPVLIWDSGVYWFQADGGGLVRVSGDSFEVLEEHLPIEQTDELSAMVSCGTRRLIAIRQGRDTLVLADDEVVERRTNADACGACRCGDDGAAVAYTDGNLVVYQGDQALSAQHTASSGVVSGAIGWDGGSLVWLTEDAGFKAWRPGASAVVSVQDEEIFRGRLRAVPAQWIVRPESGCYS